MGQKDRNQEHILFKKLEKYLRQSKCYKNPFLERKELTTALSTNETYLFCAVKTCSGMSLQRYINIIRLQEACKILKKNTDMTVEHIASVCGFKTCRTFYRQFYNQYGITPTEYRRK